MSIVRLLVNQIVLRIIDTQLVDDFTLNISNVIFISKATVLKQIYLSGRLALKLSIKGVMIKNCFVRVPIFFNAVFNLQTGFVVDFASLIPTPISVIAISLYINDNMKVATMQIEQGSYPFVYKIFSMEFVWKCF